jgi:hypothetical protein
MVGGGEDGQQGEVVALGSGQRLVDPDRLVFGGDLGAAALGWAGGEGAGWEGGCGQGRGGREEVGGGGWLRRKDGGEGCEDVRSQEQAVGLLEEEEPRCEHG